MGSGLGVETQQYLSLEIRGADVDFAELRNRDLAAFGCKKPFRRGIPEIPLVQPADQRSCAVCQIESETFGISTVPKTRPDGDPVTDPPIGSSDTPRVSVP